MKAQEKSGWFADDPPPKQPGFVPWYKRPVSEVVVWVYIFVACMLFLSWVTNSHSFGFWSVVACITGLFAAFDWKRGGFDHLS